LSELDVVDASQTCLAYRGDRVLGRIYLPIGFRVCRTTLAARVRLGVKGNLEIAGQTSPQSVVWRDTAPPSVDIVVRSTVDGLLRLYNVWDSGRGRGQESQAATSGMLREPTPLGFRYMCSDINP